MLGNRAGEAGVTRARLERSAAIAGYERVLQNVVLELKSALRDLATTFELIQATSLVDRKRLSLSSARTISARASSPAARRRAGSSSSQIRSSKRVAIASTATATRGSGSPVGTS